MERWTNIIEKYFQGETDASGDAPDDDGEASGEGEEDSDGSGDATEEEEGEDETKCEENKKCQNGKFGDLTKSEFLCCNTCQVVVRTGAHIPRDRKSKAASSVLR